MSFFPRLLSFLLSLLVFDSFMVSNSGLRQIAIFKNIRPRTCCQSFSTSLLLFAMVVMSSSAGGAPMNHHHGTGASSSSVPGGAASGGGVSGGGGGQGGQGDRNVPSLFIERPKMPRATWDALRGHILRERQRKKHEQEQSAEVERARRERERKKKQEALTLEETKEEIANAEAKLAQLKEEKHQLFHTLKRVLYEDDQRKSKETAAPQIYLQPTSRAPGVGGAAAHQYMKPPAHLLLGATAAQGHQQQQQPQQQAHAIVQPPQKRHRYSII